jgi:hypothetical protein
MKLTYETIAQIAEGVFGFGDCEAVACWRARLLPNGRLRIGAINR